MTTSDKTWAFDPRFDAAPVPTEPASPRKRRRDIVVEIVDFGDRSWITHAACLDKAALFEAASDELSTIRSAADIASGRSPLAEAKALCVSCPVRRVCLESALKEEGRAPENGRWGIRGGKGPRARADMAGVPRKGGSSSKEKAA